MDDTEKMNNREKLAIAVFCTHFLYVNEFTTFSNFNLSSTYKCNFLGADNKQ